MSLSIHSEGTLGKNQELGIELGATMGEAQTLPLCYAAPKGKLGFQKLYLSV